MFVQIMQGTCTDAAGAKRIMDRWVEELAPDAIGWLGTTAGVTADSHLIAAARFASQEQARANSDRPEQGAWWAEFSKYLEGEVTVHDCPNAQVWLGGGSDEAGFVQVMQFDILDRDAARGVAGAMSTMTPDQMERSDVIGGTMVWHGDEQSVTQIVYFTSEAAAREGEATETPQMNERMAKMATAFSEPRYFDISEPWLYSPR